MRTRLEYQERELRELAPYAVKSAESRGRRHHESEHALRSPFERDRDRVIHCGSFRKLEYKTQVFVNHEGDYYRTRLTHTLEATQIARSLARFLRLNEDLTEAIALAHDLGHPPFGHAGEQALERMMQNHGGFEHNRQGLRIVDELEVPYPGFRGLNLTWEVREGIAKHSKAFQIANPESDFVEFAETPWPSLEAQIADACDEIAYNAHDIDDGLTAGLITLPQLDELALWRQVIRNQDYVHLTAPQSKYLGVRALINEQVQDLARTIEARVRTWGIETADDVRRAPGRLAELSDAMAARNSELRAFLRANVYENYRVYRMSVKARRITEDLFASYVEHPKQLPHSVRERSADLHRAVCDYLAALTDREALNEHRRLFDPTV